MSNDFTNGHSHATPEILQAPGLISRSNGNGHTNRSLTPYAAGTESTESGGGGGGSGLSRYVHAFRRRWLISFVIGLPLAAGAAYAAWVMQPQLYTATFVLQVKPAEDHLLFVTADREKTGGSGDNFDSFKRGHRVKLRQRYVIEQMLAAPENKNLQESPVLRRQADPVTWLEKSLSIAYPEDADIMYVSLTADDPTGLDKIVNSIVDEYYKEFIFIERSRKIDRRESLKKVCKEAEEDLKDKLSRLNQLGGRTKDPLTAAQQNTLQQHSSFLQHYNRVKFEFLQEETKLQYLEQRQKALDGEIEISDADLAAALQSDSLAGAIEAERQRLVANIEETKKRVRPDKAAAAAEMATPKLEENAKAMEARKNFVREDLVRRIKLAAAAEIDQLRTKTAMLKFQYDRVEKEASEFAKAANEDAAKKAKGSPITVEMLENEIAADQTILHNLRAELGKTEVELQSSSKASDGSEEDAWARIKRLKRATTARPTDSKTKLTTTIGVAGLSFFLPFLLFVGLDASKNRISTGAEVTQAVGLSVIGAVPILPQRVMRRLNGPSESDKYWRTLLSESVDSIAAVLLRGTHPGGSRVIMVSSANAGEGKTTLAAHLAVSLAGAGRHPVLVDFDLRRPALHRVFGVTLQPGVNEILRDGQDLTSALQATQVPNLMMLSAGRTSKLGLAGLAANDLATLFTRLRSEFDFVIVDACPILPVVDTRLIGQHVDAVLLSVLRDVSRAPKLRAACDLLDMFGIPILGVVVTGSREELYRDARYEPLSEAQAV